MFSLGTASMFSITDQKRSLTSSRISKKPSSTFYQSLRFIFVPVLIPKAYPGELQKRHDPRLAFGLRRVVVVVTACHVGISTSDRILHFANWKKPNSVSKYGLK